MFDRAKGILGVGGRRKRYLNIDSASDISEVSDPATLDDETRGGWREWVGNHRGLAIAGGFFGLIALVIVLFWASKFLPALAGNPYLQAAVVLLGVGAVGFRMGAARRQSELGDVEFFIAHTRDGVTVYPGQIVEWDSDAPLFVPIKGLRFGRPQFFTNGDLDVDTARPGVSVDDPAVIQLHSNLAERFESEAGTFVAQLTNGIEALGLRSGEATLYATPPDFGDEDTIRRLKFELEEAVREKDAREEEMSRLQQRMNDVLDDLSITREEVRDDTLEQFATILALAQNPRQARSDSGETTVNVPATTNGDGTPGYIDQDTLDQIDASLSEDEDDE